MKEKLSLFEKIISKNFKTKDLINKQKKTTQC